MNASLLQPVSPIASDPQDIDVVERIDPQVFFYEYVRKNRPVLLRRMMDDWGAMQKWSFEYFRKLGHELTVHLEEGNVMQQATDFYKLSFQDYLEQLISPGEKSSSRKAYLSVFKIFDELPQLQKDVDFSLLNQHKLKPSTVGWIGPAGTVTGYHIDWGDNILAQIHGRKQLHLASPAETPNMYVSKKFDQGTTISEVDRDNYDADKHPRFADVRQRGVTLHPGEMLFIPRGWWHYVRSLDKSISVSNLAYDLKGIVVDVLPHRVKQWIHNRGLWKCDCTCHVYRNGKWQSK